MSEAKKTSRLMKRQYSFIPYCPRGQSGSPLTGADGLQSEPESLSSKQVFASDLEAWNAATTWIFLQIILGIHLKLKHVNGDHKYEIWKHALALFQEELAQQEAAPESLIENLTVDVLQQKWDALRLQYLEIRQNKTEGNPPDPAFIYYEEIEEICKYDLEVILESTDQAINIPDVDLDRDEQLAEERAKKRNLKRIPSLVIHRRIIEPAENALNEPTVIPVNSSSPQSVDNEKEKDEKQQPNDGDKDTPQTNGQENNPPDSLEIQSNPNKDKSTDKDATTTAVTDVTDNASGNAADTINDDTRPIEETDTPSGKFLIFRAVKTTPIPRRSAAAAAAAAAAAENQHNNSLPESSNHPRPPTNRQKRNSNNHNGQVPPPPPTSQENTQPNKNNATGSRFNYKKFDDETELLSACLRGFFQHAEGVSMQLMRSYREEMKQTLITVEQMYEENRKKRKRDMIELLEIFEQRQRIEREEMFKRIERMYRETR